VDQVGLDVGGGGGATVRAMIFTRFRTGLSGPGAGLLLRAGGGGNVVQGSWFGVDAATGLVPAPNGDGIRVVASPGNVIGGATVGAGNVISGNDRHGVFIAGGVGNVVQGNTIGLNPAGGAAIANGGDGLLSAGAGTLVGGSIAAARNVVSGNTAAGIHLAPGADFSEVTGNYVGTDASGTAGLGNHTFGVHLDGVAGVNVGDVTTGRRNVISANLQEGLFLFDSRDTRVRGNYIGTDATGAADLGNASSGVFVLSSTANTIGGNSFAARNVISGNGGAGVEIAGAASTNNAVIGNLIGTDAAGTGPLGNAQFGVDVRGGIQNRVGTPAVGEGNVICDNAAGGVSVRAGADTSTVQGNSIGVSLAGGPGAALGNGGSGVALGATGFPVDNCLVGGGVTGDANVIANNAGDGVSVIAGTGNRVFGNSSYANGGLAIDLANDGATPNDLNDGDGGPNQLQNFPVVTIAESRPGQTVFKGSLNTAPGTYFVDVYASPPADAAGGAEGRTYLGFAVCVVGGSFNGDWSLTYVPIVPGGYLITVAAVSSTGDTSEFAAPVVVVDAIPPRVTFADFHYQSLPHAVAFTFDEDLAGAGLSASDATFLNLTTGLEVGVNGYGFDPATHTLTFFFNGIVPDGNYRATVHAAGLTDDAGNPVDGNGDGVGGDDYTFTFYFLNADTNRDRAVDFADLIVLAQHYNQPGHPWALGDHNYDGVVDFLDLVVLAQRYNTALPGLPLVPAVPAALSTAARPGVFSTTPALDGVAAIEPVAKRPAKTAYRPPNARR
jgi:hypothetical protein